MTDSPNAFDWAAPGASPSAPPPPYEQPSVEPPRRKRNLVLWVGLPLGILTLVAVACGGLYLWSQTQYSVIERNGAVVVQQGLGPFTTYEATDVAIALLPTTTRTALVAHIPADGRAGAAAVIAHLRAQVTTCEGSLEAPCPIRPLDAATVTTTRHDYPRGDEVTISWGSLDDRKGVTTKLTINGKKPLRGCPATLTHSGICTLKGSFDTIYTIAAVTSGPAGSSPVVSQVEEFTKLKPKVTVTKGKAVRGKATDTGRPGRFCAVHLHAQGFAPDTKYKVSVLMSGRPKPSTTAFTTDPSGAFSGQIYGYADPTWNSWVAARVKGIRSKNVVWRCGSL